MKNPVIYLFFILLGLVSCEKVIDIDVEDAPQKVVIEAMLNDRDESFVKLSRTGTVYDDSGFEKISSASVLVRDGAGTNYVFAEDPMEAGTYILPGFSVLPNDSYNLSVTIDGMLYEATCPSYYTPSLDTVTYLEQIGGFGQQQTDTTYLVFYSFTDLGGQENHYRVRAWVNGQEDDFIYIFNDDLFDGQEYAAPFFGSQIESGDTVFVELIAMDQANYRYLYTLSNNADSGPFSAAPANPATNLNNDALGYFGAFTTDTLTLILP